MVRKGSRFSNLPSSSPSPSGEPRAEAQSRGSVGELPGGRVNALTLPFWAKKFHLPFPIDQACCRNHLNLASNSPLSPSCASARVLPIRSRSAFSCAPIGFSNRPELASPSTLSDGIGIAHSAFQPNTPPIDGKFGFLRSCLGHSVAGSGNPLQQAFWACE